MKLILLLTLAYTTFGSHLSVLSPPALISEFAPTRSKNPALALDQIYNNLANFGDVPFGNVILGRLYIQTSNIDGCAEFDPYDRRGDPD